MEWYNWVIFGLLLVAGNIVGQYIAHRYFERKRRRLNNDNKTEGTP